MLVKEAKKITGGIGSTTKTGLSYGIPALKTCRIGCKLAKEKNSVCAGCYGKSGNYGYYPAKTAQSRRFVAIKNITPQYIEAMAFLINRSGEKYFRWHDTGDIISTEYLDAIIKIAKKCKNVKFWLPTKEHDLINEHLEHSNMPSNLCIRLSGYYIDEVFKNRLPTSNVFKNVSQNQNVCPSIKNHKGCAGNNCRICWNKRIRNVFYEKH